ncbi:MAG: tRNA-dihydrouridine synthase, partial [Muribaculaceae bacterium]|nr:tRNA-dihydrouridine synthase [Muribaculaceae bacterium]
KADPRMEIPIIGNGDIKTAEQAKAAFDTYGVDGVMIGRASFGAPWIFREVKEYIQTGTLPVITNDEKFALLRRQIRESVDRIDEYRGILHVRRHLASTPLLKGIPDFRETRIRLLRAEKEEELENLLLEIEERFFS